MHICYFSVRVKYLALQINQIIQFSEDIIYSRTSATSNGTARKPSLFSHAHNVVLLFGGIMLITLPWNQFPHSPPVSVKTLVEVKEIIGSE